MSNTSSELLANLEARLGGEPGFISYDFQRWTSLAQVDNPLAELDPATRRRLALCKSPRRDVAFADDVMATASFTGVAAERLAGFFRLLDATDSLKAAPQAQHSAMLAAARDVVGEERPLRRDADDGGGYRCRGHPGVASFADRAILERRTPDRFPTQS